MTDISAGWSISNTASREVSATAVPIIAALKTGIKFGMTPLVEGQNIILQLLSTTALTRCLKKVIKDKIKSKAMKVKIPDPTDPLAVQAAEVEAKTTATLIEKVSKNAIWLGGKIAGKVPLKGGITMISGGLPVLGGSIFKVASRFPSLKPGMGEIKIGSQEGSVTIMGGTGNEEEGTEIYGNKQAHLWSSNEVLINGEDGQMILNDTGALISSGDDSNIATFQDILFLRQKDASVAIEDSSLTILAPKEIQINAEPAMVMSAPEQCNIKMTSPGKMTQTAGTSLTLEGPGNTISLDDDGVALDHGIVNSIKITKDGAVEISASKVTIDANTDVAISGKANISLVTDGMLQLKGSTVSIEASSSLLIGE